MKESRLFLPFLFALTSAGAVASTTRPVTLEEVTLQVSQANYFVQENAERVYQAKKGIQLARRNLLPRLNLWNVVEGVSGLQSAMNLVQDIAPFLVPNNWLRIKEEKILSEATDFGYRSLWANELLTARGLFLQASLEERLLEQLQENEKDLAPLTSIVSLREAMGTAPSGSVRRLEIRALALKEEIHVLTRVIQSNRSELAYLLGLPGNDEAVPSGVRYDSKPTQPLNYGDYENRVLSSSFELKQFDALIRASAQVKKSRYFNFLGASSMSRGISGNVFDGLPQQDGLGFGLGPSVQIVKSQKRILEIQRAGIQETLRRNLKVLVDSYNLDLESRRDALQRIEATQSQWKTLTDRMNLGAKIEVFDLVEASRNRIEAASSYYSIETRLLLGSDRLKRLTLSDAYRVAEGPLP